MFFFFFLTLSSFHMNYSGAQQTIWWAVKQFYIQKPKWKAPKWMWLIIKTIIFEIFAHLLRGSKLRNFLADPPPNHFLFPSINISSTELSPVSYVDFDILSSFSFKVVWDIENKQNISTRTELIAEGGGEGPHYSPSTI